MKQVLHIEGYIMLFDIADTSPASRRPKAMPKELDYRFSYWGGWGRALAVSELITATSDAYARGRAESILRATQVPGFGGQCCEARPITLIHLKTGRVVILPLEEMTPQGHAD